MLEGLGKPEGAGEIIGGVPRGAGKRSVLHRVRRWPPSGSRRFLDAVAVLQPALEKSPDSVAAAFPARPGAISFRDDTTTRSAVTPPRSRRIPASMRRAKVSGFLYFVTGDLEKARSDNRGRPEETQGSTTTSYTSRPWFSTAPLRSCDAGARRRKPRAPGQRAVCAILFSSRQDSHGAKRSSRRAWPISSAPSTLDPKYPLPYYKMAQIYARQGRAQQAEAARRKFSELGNLERRRSAGETDPGCPHAGGTLMRLLPIARSPACLCHGSERQLGR